MRIVNVLDEKKQIKPKVYSKREIETMLLITGKETQQ